MTEKKAPEVKKPKVVKKVKFVKATMYCPYELKDKQDAAKKLEKKLYETFGGYTNRGTCMGKWRDEEDEEYVDTNLCLEVSFKKSELPKLKKMLKEYKEEAHENAVYLDYHEVELELL